MKTKRSMWAVVAALSVVGASVLMAQQTRPSPPAVGGAMVDGARVTVYFAKVGVKDPKTKEDRKIWGGLVPFGKVWRLGANEATLLTNDKPITIGTLEVPAGAHTLYMWPNEDGTAKLIVNKQVGQWGASYDEGQDLGRVDLTKSTPTTPGEALAISIGKGAEGGSVLKISFADAEYTVPVAAKK